MSPVGINTGLESTEKSGQISVNTGDHPKLLCTVQLQKSLTRNHKDKKLKN